jgi:hypothetical protein
MTVMNALRVGLSSSMRVRQDLVISTGEIFFRRSKSEASAILMSVIVKFSG